MNFITHFITEHKRPIVITFIVITAICALLSTTVNVNKNMQDYLPDDVESTVALQIMEEEFDGNMQNSSVMIPDISIAESLAYKDQMKEIEGVLSVLWLDDAVNIKEPLEIADRDTIETYYKDGAALFSVTIEEGYETTVIDKIRELSGGNAAVVGEAAETATNNEAAGSESAVAMMILVPVILLILVLTTTSWIEPVLYLGTIGVAVLINMGLNAFVGTISSITQIVTPIMQLAVSLDYAIFLLHSFERYRKDTDDVNLAMRQALKSSFASIAASAATTLFGFLALVFMKFRIGSDLGWNLAKAILLSYLSVMVFLPTLTLYLYKIIDKTRHRRLLPDFHTIGKYLMKVRMPALVLILILVLPCFLAQKNTNFFYGLGQKDVSTALGADTVKIDNVFGTSNAMVILVPRGDTAKEAMLCQELTKVPNVKSVISYVSIIGTAIPTEYLEESIVSNFYSENYARIILYTSTENEGDEAFNTVKAVRAKTAEYYDISYSCGQSTNMYDMKTVVSKDNKVTNAIALAAIGIVLLITFKSVSLPLLLMFVIETAIWINLSIPYFTGTSLSYIGYLIMNTVQLGATIDYAILVSGSYMQDRKKMSKTAAIKATLGSNFLSVLTSAATLSTAGFGLYLSSSNNTVSGLGMLLARGTILSFTMVVCVLPAILLIFDKVIMKTTYRAEFYHIKDEGRVKQI